MLCVKRWVLSWTELDGSLDDLRPYYITHLRLRLVDIKLPQAAVLADRHNLTMPHHHHRHIHHVHEKRGAWDQLTSVAGSVWNDVFSTENKAKTAPSTIYHTVYTTMTPAGWDGGSLSTIPPVEAPTSTTTVFPDASDTLQITSATQSPDSPETSTLPASTSSSSVTLPSTLAVASPSTTARASFTQQAAATTTGAAPATASSNAASSDGDPGVAAKAGIAIGVLAGILAVFLAVWFLFNRRRKQMEERSREDDEKRDGPFSDSHAITNTASTAVKAPRLSLRPVTQFLPNLNPHPDRRASRGAAIAMTLSPTQNTNRNLVGGRTDDYSAMNSSANNVNNPFGSHAERIHTPIPEESMPVSPVSPIESEVGTAITTHSPPRGTPATLSNNVPVAAGTGLARKASMRKESAPMPLDLTRPAPLDAIPPSPAGTEFSVHSVAPGQTPGPSGSAAAIAAAGGPPQSTVHRVQLDFKPTLEDEMELRAGQLVRLLHEYDDGWVSGFYTAI